MDDWKGLELPNSTGSYIFHVRWCNQCKSRKPLTHLKKSLFHFIISDYTYAPGTKHKSYYICPSRSMSKLEIAAKCRQHKCKKCHFHECNDDSGALGHIDTLENNNEFQKPNMPITQFVPIHQEEFSHFSRIRKTPDLTLALESVSADSLRKVLWQTIKYVLKYFWLDQSVELTEETF